MNLNYENDKLEQEFECYAAVVSIAGIIAELETFMSSDLSSATRGISAGIDAVRKLTDIAIKTHNIELQEGIIAVREQLLAAKEALLNSKEDILTLKEENNKLKAKVEELEKTPQEKLVFKQIGYYTEDEDGPFCTRCYDVDKQKVRLSLIAGVFKCGQCKNMTMRR